MAIRNSFRRERRGRRTAKRLEFLRRSPGERRKSTWSFERLEDRHLLSATTADDGQTQSLSSLTPEGALQIALNEMYWANLQDNPDATYQVLSLPDDPLLPMQWHLINTGQQVGNPDFQSIFGVPGEDINVFPVWGFDDDENAYLGYTGEGVVVAVIDSGVQTAHPDLAANIHSTLGLDLLNDDNDPNPRLLDPNAAHGTAVAGIIAAVGDNGLGGSGVAPNADIVGIRLIDTVAQPPSNIGSLYAEALQYVINNDIDITNNSWGPADVRMMDGPSPVEITLLRDSVINGRNGLGTIHVFAAGNGAAHAINGGSSDAAIYDGYVNSRYTIAVTGVDHDGFYNNIDGTYTAYAEAGPSVLVAAPTGSFAFTDIIDDTGIGSGIVTTDVTGDNGFNLEPLDGFEFDRDFLEDTDYTSRFNGTSAAAPVVSGVIALMLEANPNLTWRDVQEILVRSSRQNAEFENPSIGGSVAQNNLWIINQYPLFQDPDDFESAGESGQGMPDPDFEPDPDDPDQEVPTVRNEELDFANRYLEIFYPIMDLELGHLHQYTNGAGYTVSQGYGVYDTWVGYGHGVVDAELAVTLAKRWHETGQALPPELTFTTGVIGTAGPGGDIPAAEKADDDALNLIVPGALGGESGFIDYWNEYFADDDPNNDNDGPFSDEDPPENTRGTWLTLSAPDGVNTMTVESVDVNLNLDVSSASMNNLRILLVSPDGTFTDLNQYWLDSGTADIPFSLQGGIPGDANEPGATLGGTWTFSTNRLWGERSDGHLAYDPFTETVYSTNPSTGDRIGTGQWRIYFENWSQDEIHLDQYEVAWHGSPIGEDTQRIQGFVGIDQDQDGSFNFSRVVPGERAFYEPLIEDPRTMESVAELNPNPFPQSPFEPGALVGDFPEDDRGIDGYQDIRRLFEYQNFPDVDNDGNVNHEEFAANILVRVERVSDGVIVDQFLTGADGNYYFDLEPDHYFISILDPLGRGVADGTTEIYEIDISGSFSFLPPRNFILDGGAQPADEIEVSGFVYADVDGDGVFNGDDVGADGFTVFWDVNRNGVLEAGSEPFVFTESGNYSLDVPVEAQSLVSIGAVPPNMDWTPINPASGFEDVLGGPGSIETDVDFGFKPTPGSPGGPAGVPGTILGVVYDDVNGDGGRDTIDQGIPGLRVFFDDDGDGVLDIISHNGNDKWDPGEGERWTYTGDNGAYFFSGVAPGAYRIDVERTMLFNGELVERYALTFPDPGPQIVNLGTDGTLSNVSFGLYDNANFDYGDLIDFPTLRDAENGPRHRIVSGFFMGTRVDGELDGIPTAGATGDDDTSFAGSGPNDEDGVQIVGTGVVVPGANLVRVTLVGVGGHFNGWMDLNGDGDWDDVVGGQDEHVFEDLDLNPGVHFLPFVAPDVLPEEGVASRFRWGNEGIGYVGPDVFGEVEDYVFPTSEDGPLPNQVEPMPGDYDGNGIVEWSDYELWVGTYGSTTILNADGNGDGMVNAGDYTVWQDHRGAYVTITSSGSAFGDFDDSGVVDDDDYQLWISTYGSYMDLRADGNGDGMVNAGDYTVWADHQGAVVGLGAGSGSGEGASEPLTADDESGSNQDQGSQSEPASTASFMLPGTLADTAEANVLTEEMLVGADVSVPAEPSSLDLVLLDHVLAHRSQDSANDDLDPMDSLFGSRVDDGTVDELDLCLAELFAEELSWR